MWFREMLERLRSNWHEGMPALISLRDKIDEMLQCIRASRNIRTPIMIRRQCGMIALAAPPAVSVRSGPETLSFRRGIGEGTSQ